MAKGNGNAKDEAAKGTSQDYPSIQSFFDREVATPKPAEKADVSREVFRPGDGFTEEELADALDSLNKKWNPEREYEELSIAELVPGPKAVTFVGRIVNLNTIYGLTQKQPKAAGWHSMLLKDNSAAISVKLYFSKSPYPLHLGALLTIWTTFITSTLPNATTVPSIALYANLFPGRVTSDHVLIHSSASTTSICRIPLLYRVGQELPGLMTLESFISGGHDGVAGVKLLVSVKSIGAKKKITRKGGGEVEVAVVLLVDHTREVRWMVWDGLIASVKEWVPGQTILLITNPAFKVEVYGNGKGGSLGVQQSTMIDVEPEFPDAEWLRKHVAALTRKESLGVEFPTGRWDVFAAEYGANVILFTVAEVGLWVRENSSRMFTGHINVTILELYLVRNHRRNMFMCTECCGIPIYANTATTPCSNCSKDLTLYINPKIMGTLMDDSGCIAAGKLLWSERAWEQLLGRTVKEVTEMTADEVRLLEQRMAFMRMHLVFGWDEAVGRLAILGMRS